MKRLLALLVACVLTAPAQAHFIWILPEENGAKMVFSDELAPDANVPINKIEKTKLMARDADGKTIPVTSKEAKDHYLLKTGDKQATTIGGVCQYGVMTKGKGEPFLLLYHAKTMFQVGKDAPAHIWEGWSALPLEIVPNKGKKMTAKVLWQGKPLAQAEVALIVPGMDKTIERTTDAEGIVELEPPQKDGIYGVRVKHTEEKAGELDGKKYKEIRHYATVTAKVKAAVKEKEGAQVVPAQNGSAQGKAKEDPQASKLLAEARATRALWKDFPGFSADLTVNQDGKVHKGKVEVSAGGKVVVTLEGEKLKAEVRREIGSLVSHRLPGTAKDTPCAFVDDNAEHPQGRTVRVLNDEMHSSYRIKDRQIMEVNRQMTDERFTITVLENEWNKEKHYLPSFYVVSTWDPKTKTLKSTRSHRQTWMRMGGFDLPVALLTVSATAERLESSVLTFANHKLSGGAGASR